MTYREEQLILRRIEELEKWKKEVDNKLGDFNLQILSLEKLGETKLKQRKCDNQIVT